jgi:hypothetical protein
MANLRFAFNCFALCSIETPDPEYPIDRDNHPSAQLCEGFFLTADQAELAGRGLNIRAMAEHKAWQRKACYQRDFTRTHFEIVPLASVTFESLSHLEDAICAAAVLQYSGVGKEVSQ